MTFIPHHMPRIDYKILCMQREARRRYMREQATKYIPDYHVQLQTHPKPDHPIIIDDGNVIPPPVDVYIHRYIDGE